MSLNLTGSSSCQKDKISEKNISYDLLSNIILYKVIISTCYQIYCLKSTSSGKISPQVSTKVSSFFKAKLKISAVYFCRSDLKNKHKKWDSKVLCLKQIISNTQYLSGDLEKHGRENSVTILCILKQRIENKGNLTRQSFCHRFMLKLPEEMIIISAAGWQWRKLVGLSIS